MLSTSHTSYRIARIRDRQRQRAALRNGRYYSIADLIGCGLLCFMLPIALGLLYAISNGALTYNP